MRKCIILASIFILILSCISDPEKTTQEIEKTEENTQTVRQVIEVLQRGNIKEVKNYISPYACFTFIAFGEDIRGEGSEGLLKLLESRLYKIPEFQQLLSSNPHIFNSPDGPEGEKEATFTQAGELNIPFDLLLGFRKQNNKFFIIYLGISDPVNRRAEIWADTNKNGSIDPKEMPVYIEGMRKLLFEPHEGLSGPDYIFDSNNDNNIDHIEMEMARTNLLWNFTQGMTGPWAEVLDFNNDKLIQLNEIMVLKDYIFHMPELKEPHDVDHPVDRLADENKNGRVETEEYNNFLIQVLTKIGEMPFIIQKEQDFYVEDFQVREWADVNHDGTIDNKEIISVAFTLFEAIMQPIQVASNPVLRYFDLNRDRIVDFKESKRASQSLFKSLEKINTNNIDNEALLIIDINKDLKFNDQDFKQIWEIRYNQKEIQEEHPVQNPLDSLIDEDHNNSVSHEESKKYLARLYQLMTKEWLEQGMTMRPITDIRTPLDEFSDTNKDNIVDQNEYIIKMIGLFRPHNVRNPFDKGIDFNGNAFVDSYEIEKAKRAGAVNREIINADGKYVIMTSADTLLDFNGDNMVTEEEIEKIITAVTSSPDILKDTRFFDLLDRDRDYFLSQNEIMTSIQLFLLPHPADYNFEFDKTLDTNKDKFITPEEIGIAAGVTKGGFIPNLLVRIEQMEFISYSRERKAFETEKNQTTDTSTSADARIVSEHYKNLDEINNKRLAVVGLNSITSKIETETRDGLIIFIENAFVNVGKTTVVDRQNIDSILKEHEFQLSGLTDESTAVKIGDLLGAEIIVIGNISMVGELYYLNIKLISVETSKILGSSIADARKVSEFLEMCNTAVYQIF